MGKVAAMQYIIHDAPILKISPLCHVLLHYFITRPSTKNLYNPFLTKWPEMVKVSYHSGDRAEIVNIGNSANHPGL